MPAKLTIRVPRARDAGPINHGEYIEWLSNMVAAGWELLTHAQKDLPGSDGEFIEHWYIFEAIPEGRNDGVR